jgi:CheY-like chemotaxis protein
MGTPAASIAGMQTPVRILVVDDAEQVRKILVQTLRALGFEPLQADSGPAALHLVLATPPDVAIVDQWMPDLTGAELVRLMRASSDPRVRAIPVIGLSGRPGSERELLAAGALTFLPKPFRIAQLMAALRLALEPALPASASSAA